LTLFKDGDGFISKPEFTAFFKPPPPPPTAPAAVGAAGVAPPPPPAAAAAVDPSVEAIMRIEFGALFDAADNNPADGHLNYDEVKSAIIYLSSREGVDVSTREELYFRSYFSLFDENGDGRITRDEFIEGLIHLREREAVVQREKLTLEAFFQQIDRDGNGFLDLSEVLHLVKMKFPMAGTAVAQATLARMDLNADGQVSKDEFVCWGLAHGREYNIFG